MNGPRVFNAKTAELARDGRANLFDRSGHAHVLCASENWVVVRLSSRLMESALGLPKLHSLWSHREGQSKLPIVPSGFAPTRAGACADALLTNNSSTKDVSAENCSSLSQHKRSAARKL